MRRQFRGAQTMLAAGLLLAGCRPQSATEPEADYVPLPASTAVAASTDRGKTAEFWDTYHRATAEKQAGQWESAAKLYSRSLELSPDHWDSLYYLGNCWIELGRYAEARDAYRRLADSDPQAARAFSALGALYSNPQAGPLLDLAEAERMYLRARESNGDESGSVLKLGEVCLAAGKLAEAEEYLRAATRTNFKSVNARLLRGYIAWAAGRESQAAALYREAAALAAKQKPKPIGLGEGDTKLPGSRAMVRAASHGMFDGLAEALRGADPEDPSAPGSIYSRIGAIIGGLKGGSRKAQG